MPFVDRTGARIFYEVTDLCGPWVKDPETIVFHHGICATADLWNGWLPALLERYRVVRFDMRGYGKSTITPPFGPAFSDLVGDLFAVADAAGATQFHLAGESIGGTVAMAAALAQPSRLKSLTITNAAAHGPRLANVSVWRDIVAEHGQREWATRMMDWRLFPGAVDQPRWDWFFEQHATAPMDVTLYLAELLLGADMRADLAKLTLPMLILSPDSSPFIAVDLMADIHAAVQDSEMLVVPHSKHGLPLSHGNLCAATLREFLDRRT